MEFKYPKFIVFELTDTGPLVSSFDTSHKVALHLWGRYLPYLAVFKDRRLIRLESGEIDGIEKELGGV